VSSILEKEKIDFHDEEGHKKYHTLNYLKIPKARFRYGTSSRH
jgi:hypothetical protein